MKKRIGIEIDGDTGEVTKFVIVTCGECEIRDACSMHFKKEDDYCSRGMLRWE